MCAQALDGKVIVVVGGTSGLGRSGVEACLEAGARVVAVGRNPEKVEAVGCLGAEVFARVGDAADPGCAEAAIDEAESRYGGFDGLYHVAGGSGRSAGDGPLHELTDEGVD
ncbi:MAG: SDR family NAD(P)-dependent oxidoreductase [Planctomycetota bacterium]|nr:SDR family NAD(P)-dependent oxidoreductase [Planctomycetota bacterium]